MATILNPKIKKVDADKIRPLRHLELRKGEDFSTTLYLRDNDYETLHMACFIDQKIVACATFYPEISEKSSFGIQYRLRGMATNYAFQRKGYATLLMRESIKELKKRDCDMLWCNARLLAVDFYKSIGFNIIGELFDIEAIGPHYFMFKKI